MQKLINLKGIITVLNTPFTENNCLDMASLCKNVKIALNAGVAGFLVPVMASEVDKLTEKEREQIIFSVLAEVNGQVPVIGGASAPDQSIRIRIAQKLIDSGCQGVLVSIPYENANQYENNVWEIATLNPGFLMLQDWDFNGYGIPVPLIAKLFSEIEVFRCLKIEVVPAGVKYSEVLQATKGRLHISGGWAVMQMIEALDRGVHSFMPTGMHEIYTEIYSLYHADKRDAAIELFNKLLPVLAFSNQHVDISIHFFKRLLYKQGIYLTPKVRQPILPFDHYHIRLADELIRRVEEITLSIKDTRIY